MNVLPLLALVGATIMAGCESMRSGSSPSGTGTSPSAAPIQQQQLGTEGGVPAAKTVAVQGSGSGASGSMKSSDPSVSWTSMAYPTGNPKTSVLGVDKGLPREVRLNEPFQYEMTITNLSETDLHDVVVVDAWSGGLRLQNASPEARTDPSGAMTWALGHLAPKESKTVRATGVATTEGQVGTCTTVSYNPQLCAVVPVVQPKLLVTMAGPDSALKCDEPVYTAKVCNTGSGSIRNVRLKVNLPEGVMTSDGKRMLSDDIGQLAAGDCKSYKLTIDPQRTGRFSLIASAEGANLPAVTSTPIDLTVAEPILKVSQACTESQFVNRPVDFEITVTNIGDGVARDVVLEDIFPAGTPAIASDRGQVTRGKASWNIGTLQPRASKTVTLSLNPSGAGNFTSEATARAACAAPASAACGTSVTGIPAILMEVVDVDDPIPLGDNETYIITLTNQGSAPGTNIRVVATLEGNQQYVSSSGATRGTARGAQIVFDPIRSLAPKGKAEFRVVVKAVRAGDVRFKVSMTSDQLTRPVEETEATNIYQ